MGLCCFCDQPAATDRPGAPLCAGCWSDCEHKARERDSQPTTITLGSQDSAEALERHHRQLFFAGASGRAQAEFLTLNNLAPAPAGTSFH